VHADFSGTDAERDTLCPMASPKNQAAFKCATAASSWMPR
jgi:hypothetical protein